MGGISGIVARTATAPIELFKLQRQNHYLKNNTIRYVLEKEGIRYLWKGNFTNCIRVFPQYGINFTTFYNVKPFCKKITKNQNLVHFLSGGIAGVVSMSMIYPLETARTHLSLQTHNSKYSGLLNVLKTLKVHELFAGLRMSILGFGPWNAINFMSYFKYKKVFEPYKENKNIYKLLCGGFSGITALSITYPSDLIRKRLQMQSFSENVPEYKGIIDCARKIIRSDGLLGLYRGLWVGYIKCFPTLAVQFWTYDTLKELYKKDNYISI